MLKRLRLVAVVVTLALAGCTDGRADRGERSGTGGNNSPGVDLAGPVLWTDAEVKTAEAECESRSSDPVKRGACNCFLKKFSRIGTLEDFKNHSEQIGKGDPDSLRIGGKGLIAMGECLVEAADTMPGPTAQSTPGADGALDKPSEDTSEDEPADDASEVDVEAIMNGE